MPLIASTGQGTFAIAESVARFLGALQQSRALHAMALIVTDAEQSRYYNAAHQVRISTSTSLVLCMHTVCL